MGLKRERESELLFGCEEIEVLSVVVDHILCERCRVLRRGWLSRPLRSTMRSIFGFVGKMCAKVKALSW